MNFLGEFAALFTSGCWALSAVFFTHATGIFGPQVTNRLRTLLAFLILVFINVVFYGRLFPPDTGSARWIWLSISGMLGLALGDTFLFASYKYVGPRLGLLILSLAPVFGGLIAWIFFAEVLTFLQLAGMVITLGAISYVVIVRPGDSTIAEFHLGKGILFGVLAALGQAIGLVLSKQGMVGNYPAFAGSLIRMTAAGGLLWIVALFQGQAGRTVSQAGKNPVGLRWAILGAIFGPVLGVSSALLSIQHAEVGVASTLMALPPVFMLPISRYYYNEPVNLKAILGTLAVMVGVALFFLG